MALLKDLLTKQRQEHLGTALGGLPFMGMNIPNVPVRERERLRQEQQQIAGRADLNDQEAQVLASVASNILTNSRSDEEANALYRQAKPRLAQNLKDLPLPESISRNDLAQFVTAAQSRMQSAAPMAPEPAPEMIAEEPLEAEPDVFVDPTQDSGPSPEEELETIKSQLSALSGNESREAAAERVKLQMKLGSLSAQLGEPIESLIDKTPEQTEVIKSLQKQDIKALGERKKQATESKKILSAIDNFRGVLKDFKTGALSPAKIALLKTKQATGTASAEDLKKLSAAEALKSFQFQFVKENLAATKGSVSDREMQTFTEAAPNLMNSPEGNELLLSALEGTIKRANARVKFDEAHMKKHGSLEGADKKWKAFIDSSPILKYKVNGNDVSLTELNDLAKKKGVSLEEVIKRLNVKTSVDSKAVSNFDMSDL